MQNSQGGSDVRTRLYAAKTLAELAKNDDNKARIIQEGGLVPLIVWAKGFGNIEVQQSACEALSKLGVDSSLLEGQDDEHNDTGEEANADIGTAELVQLAMSDFIEIQLFAAGELANTALNRNQIKDIIEKDGLLPLFKLCNSPNETVQAQATRALLNLSSEDDGLNLAELEAQRKVTLFVTCLVKAVHPEHCMWDSHLIPWPMPGLSAASRQSCGRPRADSH